MGGLKGGKIVNDEANRAKIEAAAKLVRRIEQGDSDDLTGPQALARFGVVASKLSPEELDEAAEKELKKLPEDQRVQFGKLLQDAGQISPDVDVADVRSLARATSTGSAGGAGIAGLLGGLLGGGGGGGQAGGLDLGGLLGGLLGGGGGSSQQAAGGLDVGGLLGGLLGGGGGSSQQGSAGGLDVGGLLGGLLGGGGGSSQQAGGGLDIGGMLGGLLGGGGGGTSTQAASGGGGMDLGDLINNPLVKSVIAGIAGNGMEKVVGNAGGIDSLLGGLVGGDDAPAAKEDDGDLPNAKKGVIA